MSKYSARRLRHNRYVNWKKAVAQWKRTPFKLNTKGELIPIPEPVLCPVCYYRRCSCGRI